MSVNDPSSPLSSQASKLCLRCGLCCNGVIFADVKLGSPRELARIRRAGLAPTGSHRGTQALPTTNSEASVYKLVQPCEALDGCRCRIYADRPSSCRAFECLLFKNVEAGRLKQSAALQIIQSARRRTDRVMALLLQLGNEEQELPIKTRFKNVSRRIETGRPDKRETNLYADLTLAFHELNALLREAFYR